MNSFINISKVQFVLLAVLFLSACDQSEPSKKIALGTERTSIGSWAEGLWEHVPKDSTLPDFRLSGEKITLGQCTFTANGLLSPDGAQVFLVSVSTSACPSEQHTKNIVLTQRPPCQALIDRYDSADEISQERARVSGLYRKEGYVEPH